MDSDRIQGSIKEVAGKGEAAVGEFAGDAKLQAEGKIREAGGAAQNAYGRAKDMARDALDRAPEAWSEAVNSGQDYASRGAQVARQRMSEQPIGALLLAAAVGYLLGWAIHGRS